MFIRSDPPSETSRKLGRGITVAYMAGTVAFVALFNLTVAGHLLLIDQSSLWVWLQIGGIGLLAVAIFGLVHTIRTTRPPDAGQS